MADIFDGQEAQEQQIAEEPQKEEKKTEVKPTPSSTKVKPPVSPLFEQAVKSHLDNMAAQDEAFAKHYANPKKNLYDCLTYILNQAKNSGCQGYSSEEVYGMAVHYYVEDEVKVGSPVACNVIVDHRVELTPEELSEAREKAKKRAMDDAVAAMKKKPVAKKRVEDTPSLF